jgi:sugar lactone lactonase YvrE
VSAERSQASVPSTPIEAPPLGYEPVPDIFELPPGMNFGACSSVAVNSKGHIFVFHRGAHALLEFESSGKFRRSLIEGIFTRPHGLRVDAQDNLWATDGAANIVVKMDPNGRIRMVLGVKDSNAEWHPAGHLRCFDEPNDVALGPDGEIFVSQGHGKGESRVLMFDGRGRFIKTWGGEGSGPGQFRVPHSVVMTADGLLYVADRSNQRIQVFDRDGKFVRESQHPGTPCGLCTCHDGRHMLLAHGHSGCIMKLDLHGKVLGITGGQGKGPNEYGEAHFIALSNDERSIYVADPLNWRVQTLVRK